MDMDDHTQLQPADLPPLALAQPLAQQLVDYLVRRPYGEVHELVAGLVALKPIEQASDKKAKK